MPDILLAIALTMLGAGLLLYCVWRSLARRYRGDDVRNLYRLLTRRWQNEGQLLGHYNTQFPAWAAMRSGEFHRAMLELEYMHSEVELDWREWATNHWELVFRIHPCFLDPTIRAVEEET